MKQSFSGTTLLKAPFYFRVSYNLSISLIKKYYQIFWTIKNFTTFNISIQLNIIKRASCSWRMENIEIEEQSQEEVRAPFFQRLFSSTKWKKFMQYREFILSLWMLCDIIMDIVSCFGYFTKWVTKTNIYLT